MAKIGIRKKSQRFESSLVVIAPDSPEDGDSDYVQYNDSFKSNNEDGDEGLNDSDSSSSTNVYESDFESNHSSSDETGNDFEYAECTKEIDLGSGTSIVTSEKSFDALNRFTTIQMNVFDRNLNFKGFELAEDRKFASDIFKILLKSRVSNYEGCDFCFPYSMKTDILFKVPVIQDIFPAGHDVVKFFYEFSVAFTSGADWQESSAEYEGGFPKFYCCKLKSFCILTKSRKIPQLISSEGSRFKTGSDGKLIVEYPPGHVRTKKRYKISVALALVHTNTDNMDYSLVKELDIFYGKRILCCLMLFAKSVRGGIELMTCCATHSEAENYRKRALSNLCLIFQSDAVCLLPLQRIRIHLRGCLQAIPGLSYDNYFFTFLSGAKHNSLSFPVRLGAGGCPYAIIDFLCDNIQRGKLAELHFEPHLPFKCYYKNFSHTI